MIEKIKKSFMSLRMKRLTFNPAIRVKQQDVIIWIDDIFHIKDNVMITISTLNDNRTLNINNADDNIISLVSKRMEELKARKRTS